MAGAYDVLTCTCTVSLNHGLVKYYKIQTVVCCIPDLVQICLSQ